MTAFVALFRGINVGGNHQVKMDALRALHEALGLQGVAAYIQSGNVVFTSDDTDVVALKKRLEERFEQAFGFSSEVMLRTSAELEAIIGRSPFKDQPGRDTRLVVVLFLASSPDATAQEALLKAHAGPEELFISGQEAYIYYPDGQGRSKLSGSFIEKKLKTMGTARNWNTVLQLQKLLQRTT